MGACCAQTRQDPNAPLVEGQAGISDGRPTPAPAEQMAVLKGHAARRAAKKTEEAGGADAPGPETTPEPASSSGPLKSSYANKRAERSSNSAAVKEESGNPTRSRQARKTQEFQIHDEADKKKREDGHRDSTSSLAGTFESDWTGRDSQLPVPSSSKKGYASMRAAKRANDIDDSVGGKKEADASGARQRYQAAKEAASKDKGDAEATEGARDLSGSERDLTDREKNSLTKIQAAVRGTLTRDKTKQTFGAQLSSQRREMNSAKAAMAGLSSLPVGNNEGENSNSDGELFEF